MDACRVRWRVEVPGSMAHAMFVDAGRRRLLVRDGWGTKLAALRLRALDAATGSEVASVKLGNAARTITPLEGAWLVATDKKLFRLDAETLAEEARWTAKVPRYAGALIAVGGWAHLAVSRRPTLTALHLETGATKRQTVASAIDLHPLDDERFLVASGEGRIWRARAGLGRTLEDVATTPPFADSILDSQGRIWLSLGNRFETEDATYGPGAPTSELAWLDTSSGNPVLERTDVGVPFRKIAVSPDGEHIAVLAVPRHGSEPSTFPGPTEVVLFRTADARRVGTVTMPDEFRVVTVSFPLASGWATRPIDGGDARAELICFELPRA